MADEHNVPLALTPLIGRERDLRGIGDTLRKARLVTVAGPGGVGKTRLSIEFARSQIGRRRDGVWFVDLALGAESPDVAAETARMLDVRSPSATTPTAALRAYLAERDLLLVLDNCEHVADACAELAQALLTSCPKARIVATSRESLGVAGESVWRLEPLDPKMRAACSSSAHGSIGRRSSRPRRPTPRSPSSVTASIACRSRSRSPRLA